MIGRWRTYVSAIAFGLVPAVLVLYAIVDWHRSGTLAWDFHHELYPQAEAMLHGDNPYPGPDHNAATGTNRVWPPVAAYLVAPLTLLEPATADLVIAALGLACFGLALWLVGVRDWRVYGVVALWPSVFIEPGLSHLTPLMTLLVAIAWRDARNLRSGVAVGLSVALKLFTWPVVVWLASVDRRTPALTAALAGAGSLLLVLPFTSFHGYVHALLALGRAFDQDGYSLVGLAAQVGAGETAGRVATVVAGGALLLATWRYRSFSLAVATALVASPIVWLDYFALAAVPLAIARPRLSPAWFVPLGTIGLEGAGLGIGDSFGTLRVLVAFTLVFAVAFSAEPGVGRVSLSPRSERVAGRLRPGESP